MRRQRPFFFRAGMGWKSSKNFHCGMVPAKGAVNCRVGHVAVGDAVSQITFWSLRELLASIVAQDTPDRQFCPVQLSESVVGCTCTECLWTIRINPNDIERGRAAFDEHHCEDFPRPERFCSVTHSVKTIGETTRSWHRLVCRLKTGQL